MVSGDGTLFFFFLKRKNAGGEGLGGYPERISAEQTAALGTGFRAPGPKHPVPRRDFTKACQNSVSPGAASVGGFQEGLAETSVGPGHFRL